MHFVVANIPESFRTRDLRNFFSEYVERGAFNCFHFRHRPQSQLTQLKNPDLSPNKPNVSPEEDSRLDDRPGIDSSLNEGNEELDDGVDASPIKSHSWLSSGLSGLAAIIDEKKKKKKLAKSDWRRMARGSKKDADGVQSLDGALALLSSDGSKRTCCILDVGEGHEEGFPSKYDRKHWVATDGQVQPARCVILTVNLERKDADDDYRTKKEVDAQSLSLEVPRDLIEFRPPPVMPRGNVGTPTRHFKDLIRTCQLPGTVMMKLGLKFPRGRGKKRFSQVPFNYGTGITKAKKECSYGENIAFTAAGHLIPSSADFSKIINKPKKKLVSKTPKLELLHEKEDGAEVEEWERYEAFHNDVTSQDRTQERLYEKEIELVWEKGGPGLVFYTDAQYWREQEGDFDEQTADEWDVDMSVYYEEGAGDLDAQNSIAMLHSNKLRRGELTQSAFRTAGKHTKEMKMEDRSHVKKRRIGPAAPPPIGEFEVHTRGFGRRLMEAQGWQDGQGLGRDAVGLPYALDNEGQHPHSKMGFGYHGEKLQGWGNGSKNTQQQNFQQRPQQHQKHFISTVFDHPLQVDPPAPTLRTQEPSTLSHRHGHISFTKASES